MDHYNHTRRRWANGDIDPTQLKAMLLNAHAFDPAHENVSAVEADEVHGNGWTEGGEPLANATLTTTGTNEATLDADDIVVGADGGSIGPATQFVIYQDVDTEEYVLYHDDFQGTEEAGDGTDFRIDWHENGIAR